MGIRESSIYNHYKGKEDLMDSITGFFIAELSKYNPEDVPMEPILKQYGPEGFMDIAGRTYLERLKNPRMEKIWRLIAIELYRNRKVRDFFKTTMVEVPLQSWDQTFRQMMDLGYIREYDTRLLAREFFNYCLYIFFEYFFLRYEDETYDTFVDSIMDNLSDHIRFMFEKVKIEEAA